MRLTEVRPRRGKTHTPLRYPGGKTRLYGLIRDLISAMPSVHEYAEPFGGGAGAAISLAINGDVDRIHINDLDPCVYSFWVAATSHSTAMAEMILDAELSIAEWKRQREIYRTRDLNDKLRLGFATFYLNRTNRSGVLTGGVIGGLEQAGTYRMDARFNRASLSARVLAIGGLGSAIQVTNDDGATMIRRHLNKDTLIYADPPYFDKGALLYLNAFDDKQHEDLATLLNANTSSNWLLTYDDVAKIRSLYGGRNQGLFDLPYSAHSSQYATERMIMSNTVSTAMDSLRGDLR